MNLKSYRCSIDSNCVTYLFEAMGMDYCLENDLDHKLRPERISLFKIFMYWADLIKVPTVEEEIERINDNKRKDSHSIFSQVVLGTVGTRENLGEESIKSKRDSYLRNFGHNKLKDCQILAETEVAGLRYLLTCDEDFIQKLSGKTKIILIKPSEYWRKLKVPVGRKPVRTIDQTHPHYSKSWWKI